MDHLHLFRGAAGFIKKNVVMVVALVAAVITCFFCAADAQYWGYFNVKTLTCLFCVLALACAEENARFLENS